MPFRSEYARGLTFENYIYIRLRLTCPNSIWLTRRTLVRVEAAKEEVEERKEGRLGFPSLY
ncbi:MAG: hypothetical protein ACK55Z_38055 [bacterium]|jgi:hypothetical protein